MKIAVMILFFVVVFLFFITLVGCTGKQVATGPLSLCPPCPPTPPPPVVSNYYLTSKGSKLLDGAGNVVRLKGVNWFGFETDIMAPHGLWAGGYKVYLKTIKSLGFNLLRFPFSNDILKSSARTKSINTQMNPDLSGLTPLQVMDKIIAEAGRLGIMVMLDRHRPTQAGQTSLWYTPEVSEVQWIFDWVFLARRYEKTANVIAFDLNNEPHNEATWGSGDMNTDMRLAYQRCGNAIHAVNPNLLIVAEGVQAINNNWTWWGGNLSNASLYPVLLNIKNKVLYSSHDYPASVYSQAWFNDPAYPNNLEGIWDGYWGYLAKNDLAPIFVGEFGTKLQTDSDKQWLQKLCAYIKNNQMSFAFWTLNPNSGDTGGLLKDDWHTLETAKIQALQGCF